ncbi:hypothetical protein AB9L18_18455 [Stenotrophomonas lactitubi]|uniref:hypothetical protein n=1 Tax=Stenotrophomonas lactitubi TaxID=2045214 RepID=UPI0035C22ECF
MAWIYVSTKVDTHHKLDTNQEQAMPPRHPTECPLLPLPLLWLEASAGAGRSPAANPYRTGTS